MFPGTSPVSSVLEARRRRRTARFTVFAAAAALSPQAALASKPRTEVIPSRNVPECVLGRVGGRKSREGIMPIFAEAIRARVATFKRLRDKILASMP